MTLRWKGENKDVLHRFHIMCGFPFAMWLARNPRGVESWKSGTPSSGVPIVISCDDMMEFDDVVADFDIGRGNLVTIASSPDKHLMHKRKSTIAVKKTWGWSAGAVVLMPYYTCCCTVYRFCGVFVFQVAQKIGFMSCRLSALRVPSYFLGRHQICQHETHTYIQKHRPVVSLKAGGTVCYKYGVSIKAREPWKLHVFSSPLEYNLGVQSKLSYN